MNSDAIDDIMAMFDINPSTKSEDGEAADYNTTAEDAVEDNFDELIVDIGDAILDGAPDSPKLEKSAPEEKKNETAESAVEPSSTEADSEEEKSTPEQTLEAETQDMDEDNLDDADIDVDDMFSDSGSSQEDSGSEESNIESEVSDSELAKDEEEKPQSKEAKADAVAEAKTEEQENASKETAKESSPDKATPFDLAEENEDEDTPTETHDSKVDVKDDLPVLRDGKELKWILSSGNEKFSKFYRDKHFVIETLLPSGPIDTDRYERDLRDAHVDLRMETGDFETLNERLTEVQTWKDRVVEIAGAVNKQYYAWDRFVDLMQGKVAQIEKAKNAEARQGLYFEHLRDMALYQENLKFLHHHITQVLKNLDSAWETLSRRITIWSAERDEITRYKQGHSYADRHAQPKESTSREPKANPELDGLLDDCDGIEGSPTAASSKQKGTQTIDWEDM